VAKKRKSTRGKTSKQQKQKKGGIPFVLTFVV
jgi:hypothetical protein